MKRKVFSLLLVMTLCIGIAAPVSAAYTPEFQKPSIQTSIASERDGRYNFILKSNGELWGYVIDFSDMSKIESQKILDNVVAISGVGGLSAAFHCLTLQSDGTLWDCSLSEQPAVEGVYDGKLKIKAESEKINTGVSKIGDSRFIDCYLKSDGSLYSFKWEMGSNSYKSAFIIGDVIDFADISVYVTNDNVLHYEGGTLSNIASVTAAVYTYGYKTYFAVAQNGDLYSWGYNSLGMVGNGGKYDDAENAGFNAVAGDIVGIKLTCKTPAVILSKVTDVYANSVCSFARDSNGTLWQWGDATVSATAVMVNVYQFGEITLPNNSTPRKSSTATPVYSNIDGVTIKGDGMFAPYFRIVNGVSQMHEVKLPVAYSEVMKADTSITIPEPVANTPSSWAVESVNAAIAAGLVPDALQSKYTTATTRAEFCALAVALYEIVKGAEITERATFSDSTDINVQKMAGLGVVNGIGDGKFGPENKLTREQAATMLSRLADAIGKPLTEQAPTFGDSASISSWAVDAVGQMQATGIMSGVGDNTFSPATDYTREQSIITIMRLLDYIK